MDVDAGEDAEEQLEEEEEEEEEVRVEVIPAAQQPLNNREWMKPEPGTIPIQLVLLAVLPAMGLHLLVLTQLLKLQHRRRRA